MNSSTGSTWGPPPLPEFLRGQLRSRGYASDDATVIAQQLSEVDDPPALLFVDLGTCKFLEGDIDGAIASWRHGIASADDEAAAAGLLNLGLLYEHVHLHTAAVSVLRSVPERRSATYDLAASMAKARCERDAGLFDDAMETMARLARELMADDADEVLLAEVLYGLGDVAVAAGRSDRAQRAWRVAAAGPTSSAQAAAAEGLVALLVEHGQDDHLIELLTRFDVRAASPKMALVLDRAETLVRTGSDEAAKALLLAVPAEQLRAADRYRLGEVRLEAGLVNEAIDELEVLLDDADAQIQQRSALALADVYQSYEMDEPAVQMYQKVIANDDTYWTPQAMLGLGDLHANAGRNEAAATWWTQASTYTRAGVAGVAAERLRSHDFDPSPVPDPREVSAAGDGGAAGPSQETAAADEPTVVDLAMLESTSPAEGSPDPVVVVLSSVDDDDLVPAGNAGPRSNPYAALAPAGASAEPGRSPNPYAELSPDFEDADLSETSSGAWASLIGLDEIADHDADGAEAPGSAFSRYT